MSLIPSFFGRRSSDPFSLDLWDPFPDSGNEKETREAHVFKADVPGLKKKEVKVEVEEGNVLQIRKRRTTPGTAWSGAPANSYAVSAFRRMPRSIRLKRVWRTGWVLTVTVPKEEVKKPQVKAIDISG